MIMFIFLISITLLFIVSRTLVQDSETALQTTTYKEILCSNTDLSSAQQNNFQVLVL